VIGDKIVDKVSSYISSNITQSNITLKISALLVLGSIHEGPSEAKMTTFISSLLPTQVALLRDENLTVRQTASWTLSRTCEFYYKIISHPNNFNIVLPVLLEKL